MRILALDQFGELGGGQKCFLEAIGGFVKRGWEVYAAAPKGPLLPKLEACCAGVSALEWGPFASGQKTLHDVLLFARQWSGQVTQLKSLTSSTRADLLYVNGPRVLPIAVRVAGMTPVVFHSHSVVSQTAAAFLLRRAATWSNVSIIASSEWAAKGFPESRTRIVYNGVRRFDVRDGRRRLIRRIGVAGRISPEKGHLAFVRAAELLRTVLPEVEFVIRGSGASSKYVRRVQTAAAKAGVTLLPWVDDPRAVFEGVDLVVVPSEPVENTPRVILEAYAARVPVVAFASGGIPEIVKDGFTGVLVHERSAEALAEAILEAVRASDRTAQMAETAFSRWRSEFTIERFQGQVCDALEEAMRRRQRIPARITGTIVPQ